MGQRSDEVTRYDRDDDSVFDQDTGASSSAGAYETQDMDNTAEIRTGIEQTRAEMSETIEAIQERLSPQHLKAQVQEQVREQFHEAKAAVRDATIGKAETMVRNAGDTLTEARYGLMETIRQNPIPAALVGIGLGWLFVNRRGGAPRNYNRYYDQSRSYRGGQPYYGGQRGYTGGENYYAGGTYAYGGQAVDESQRGARGTLQRAQAAAVGMVDRAQETAGTVADRTQETVGNVVSQAQETASTIASQTQEAVGYVADQAQYQAQRLEDRFQEALYQNPLAVGAVALALGTAAGFALPQTQRENELLGEARDTLIDRAQEVAQDTLEKVQQVAGDVVGQAQTTVQEKARERGLTTE